MAKQTAIRTLKKSDVLKATDISQHTFQHWLDRRVITLAGDDFPGDGKGKPRRFGLRTISQIAIAHRIASLGVPATTAVNLAAKFTNEPQCGRPIGGLFPRGRTILMASHEGTARVINIEPDSTIDAAMTGDASIIVDVGAILSTIHSRLDNLA